MNARPLRYTIDSAWDAWHESEEDTARDWLVVHYASLVKFVAGRLAAGLPRTVDTGDLDSLVNEFESVHFVYIYYY